ncbi:hypothetical protein B0H11DRAFT_2217424 [Mycena galericulata]|nr:hypothetical protein B0H11DRAFT_2217424 [Mycena galericulata]
MDRKNQLSNIVEAIKALRRREAAPIAPKRRIAFPRAGQALRLAAGRRVPAEAPRSGAHNPETTHRVPASGPSQPLPATRCLKLQIRRSTLFSIPPDPDTYNLRPVLRMSKPQDDVPTSRELRLSLLVATGHINAGTESTHLKPSIQNSIFGHPANMDELRV